MIHVIMPIIMLLLMGCSLRVEDRKDFNFGPNPGDEFLKKYVEESPKGKTFSKHVTN